VNEHFERDPLDALRAADPVDADRLSSASLARIRARVREDAMTNDPQRRPGRPARLATLGAGLIAVGALALVLAVGRVGDRPGLGPSPSADPGSALCIEQYSLVTLANRAFAFDGTVTAIDGDRVSFTVHHAYRGAGGGSITLDAAGMTGPAITIGGGPSLVIGQRFLVAGEDHFVWGCGFTQPYDEAIAAQWAAAFGG
jgi:hypothetical protein